MNRTCREGMLALHLTNPLYHNGLKRMLGKAVYFCDVTRKPTRATHL